MLRALPGRRRGTIVLIDTVEQRVDRCGRKHGGDSKGTKFQGAMPALHLPTVCEEVKYQCTVQAQITTSVRHLVTDGTKCWTSNSRNLLPYSSFRSPSIMSRCTADYSSHLTLYSMRTRTCYDNEGQEPIRSGTRNPISDFIKE